MSSLLQLHYYYHHASPHGPTNPINRQSEKGKQVPWKSYIIIIIIKEYK